MSNLRIIYDNAISRTALTASSVATGFAASNLKSDKKSNVWRAVGTAARLDARWADAETIGGVALPFCNLSPTATMRVRLTNEAPATNLLTYSEQVDNPAWAKATISTIGTNAIQAPDGTMNADKLIPASGSLANARYVDHTISGLSDNTPYSTSCFFKAGGVPRARLELITKSGTGASVDVNLEDGRTVRTTPLGNSSFDMKPVGDGWYRVMVNNVDVGTGAIAPRLRAVVVPHTSISSAAWPKTGVTAATDTTVASPVAGWPVEKMLEQAVTSGHYVGGAINAVTGKTMVFEQYMRALGAGQTRYGSVVFAAGAGIATTHGISVNLSTGAIVNQGANPQFSNVSVTDAGAGWWKLQWEFTPTLTGTLQWQVRTNNATNSVATSHLGDASTGMYVCQPYGWFKEPDNTVGIFVSSASVDLVGDGVSGVYAWGGQFELGPVTTSYYPAGAAATTRPLGHMDGWQSYDYDSSMVLACPASPLKPRGWTTEQAASAYAYGGGACARHWLPAGMQAYGLAVDISDPNNLQGYIEAACFVAGPAWTPKYNATSARATVADTTELYRTDAGDQIAEAGTIRKKVAFDLSALNADDRAAYASITRNSRAHPVLVSVFAGASDLERERDYTVYGRRTRDAEIATAFAGAYSTTDEIEEI